MIRLYDIAVSGNCHKVRLMLSLLGLAYETKPVDIAKGELKSPEFLARNPLGQVPVLTDGDLTLRDSQAICFYLAKKYGKGRWLAEDAAGLGRIMQWLSFSANEIANGPARARFMVRFKAPGDLEGTQKAALRALGLIDSHLAGRSWLETGAPTVADIACYPYTKAAPEGGVPLDRFANLRAWHARIEALPGFVAF
jgi:glutathione S-transferase